MRERIFLTYTNATAMPYHGAVIAHHVVINYIDANGKHHTLEGIPERKFNHNLEKLIAFSLEEGRPHGGTINTDSRFRRLRAKEGKGDPDALNKPHTMIARADDLSSQWDQMKKFGVSINATGYELSSNFPKQQFFCSRSVEAGRISRARYCVS